MMGCIFAVHVLNVGLKSTNEAGAYAAASHNAHRYLFLCVSQPEISGVRTIRPQSQQKWRREGGQVRGTLSSSDLLFFLSLKTQRSSFIRASALRETGSVCITDSIHHLQLKDLSHL